MVRVYFGHRDSHNPSNTTSLNLAFFYKNFILKSNLSQLAFNPNTNKQRIQINIEMFSLQIFGHFYFKETILWVLILIQPVRILAFIALPHFSFLLVNTSRWFLFLIFFRVFFSILLILLLFQF